MSTSDNIRIYDDNAKRMAARYGSISTREALPVFTHAAGDYAGKSRAALDIGCGLGRDSLWMAQHGWQVDAIDGSKGLLAEAMASHSHPAIRYRHEMAPAFDGLRESTKRYDMILMSAFIFHFTQDERQAVLEFCASMLAPSGLIYLTLRRGPDLINRHIFDVPVAEIEDFAAKNGLSSRYHGRGQDGISPDGVTWDHLSLWRGAAWDHARGLSLDPAHR